MEDGDDRKFVLERLQSGVEIRAEGFRCRKTTLWVAPRPEAVMKPDRRECKKYGMIRDLQFDYVQLVLRDGEI